MQVALDDAGETIKAVRFTGDGCAISMASASGMLSERLHGMSIEELDALDTDDITEMLGVDISDARKVRGAGPAGRAGRLEDPPRRARPRRPHEDRGIGRLLCQPIPTVPSPPDFCS